MAATGGWVVVCTTPVADIPTTILGPFLNRNAAVQAAEHAQSLGWLTEITNPVHPRALGLAGDWSGGS